jgi:hypothetical protein
MASTSEQTFGNRLEHSRHLSKAVALIPAYAPDNSALSTASYATFLNSVEAANDLVAEKAQLLSDARDQRRLAFFGDTATGTGGLATLSGRVRDHVGSMPGGKNSAHYKQIQRLTQKITNYHPPKKPVSGSPGATSTEKKKVSQSERSYGSLVQFGRDLAAAAAKVPGYTPTAADIKPANLVLAMKALADKNDAVATALAEARDATDSRAAIYDHPETGLKSVFQQVKAAVASQFGRRSSEYGAVGGIRY